MRPSSLEMPTECLPGQSKLKLSAVRRCGCLGVAEASSPLTNVARRASRVPPSPDRGAFFGDYVVARSSAGDHSPDPVEYPH